MVDLKRKPIGNFGNPADFRTFQLMTHCFAGMDFLVKTIFLTKVVDCV